MTINQPKHLAYVLRVNLKEIISITENIDNYYTEYRKQKQRGYRIINPSHNRLKVIQQRIQQRILQEIALPDYAYGAVRGRDNVDNANQHKGKPYKFTTDLRTYFPSISHRRVNQMFVEFGFSHAVARLLTQLTTYKGRLPQGAPTSSTIANLVFVRTGENLQAFAQEYQITFTSFVDDLAFSSPHDFKDITSQIIEMITKDGFQISHSKTHYSRSPVITGLKVKNNTLKPPDAFLDRLNDDSDRTPEQRRGDQGYMQKVQKANRGGSRSKK